MAKILSKRSGRILLPEGYLVGCSRVGDNANWQSPAAAMGLSSPRNSHVLLNGRFLSPPIALGLTNRISYVLLAPAVFEGEVLICEGVVSVGSVTAAIAEYSSGAYGRHPELRMDLIEWSDSYLIDGQADAPKRVLTAHFPIPVPIRCGWTNYPLPSNDQSFWPLFPTKGGSIDLSPLFLEIDGVVPESLQADRTFYIPGMGYQGWFTWSGATTLIKFVDDIDVSDEPLLGFGNAAQLFTSGIISAVDSASPMTALAGRVQPFLTCFSMSFTPGEMWADMAPPIAESGWRPVICTSYKSCWIYKGEHDWSEEELMTVARTQLIASYDLSPVASNLVQGPVSSGDRLFVAASGSRSDSILMIGNLDPERYLYVLPAWISSGQIIPRRNYSAPFIVPPSQTKTFVTSSPRDSWYSAGANPFGLIIGYQKTGDPASWVEGDQLINALFTSIALIE